MGPTNLKPLIYNNPCFDENPTGKMYLTHGQITSLCFSFHFGGLPILIFDSEGSFVCGALVSFTLAKLNKPVYAFVQPFVRPVVS